MPRAKITLIHSKELCSYGCMNVALFINGSKKLMCADSPNKCPANKLKNSNALKQAHKEGKVPGWNQLEEHYNINRAWRKGLTKETDQRIENHASTIRGKRKLTDKEKLKQTIYREQCSFNLTGIIENVKGYKLLVQRGMYDRIKNPDGVVRDHRISINHGYKNNIDPSIISHPANCEFLPHKANASKSRRCSLSLTELFTQIDNWNGAQEET